MGLPKSFKTGAVVGTYPKPMLVVVFRPEELDVIPSAKVVIPPDYVPLNCTAEDIKLLKPDELPMFIVQNPQLPKVVAVNFGNGQLTGQDPMDLNYKPRSNAGPMVTFVERSNQLFRLDPFPFKTVVFENLSDFSDIILQHMASINAPLTDARFWSPMVGSKILQTVTEYTRLPAHVIFIMHSQMDRNELTGEINVLPKVYSGVRDIMGKLFSSFLYATKENGKPVVYTTDRGFVKGIGVRWPVGLPPVCPPDFTSLYGKEI